MWPVESWEILWTPSPLVWSPLHPHCLHPASSEGSAHTGELEPLRLQPVPGPSQAAPPPLTHPGCSSGVSCLG